MGRVALRLRPPADRLRRRDRDEQPPAPDELAVKDVPVPHSPQAHEAATGGGGTAATAHLAHPERILAQLEGKALEGVKYRHPL